MDDLSIFILLISLYVIILILMRLMGIFKKDRCPKCTGRISRKNKTFGDRMIIGLTLGILPLRRYKCVHCGWAGLRWNTKKRKERSRSERVPHLKDEEVYPADPGTEK